MTDKTQKELTEQIEDLLTEMIVPFDTSDLPPNIKIMSPSLKVKEATSQLLDIVNQARVEELENLPYQYHSHHNSGNRVCVSKTAINYRIKQLKGNGWD